MNEKPRYPELPYVSHRNPYTFQVTYPVDCKREHYNLLGLPAVEGKSRTFSGPWVDLGVLAVFSVWDFGAVETCRVIERILREQQGKEPDPEVWWLDGVYAGQKWAEANCPRPAEPTFEEMLADAPPPPRRLGWAA